MDGHDIHAHMGIWSSGMTADSKPVNAGSIPAIPAMTCDIGPHVNNRIGPRVVTHWTVHDYTLERE